MARSPGIAALVALVLAASTSCAGILGIDEPVIEGRIELDATVDTRTDLDAPVDVPKTEDASDARTDAGPPPITTDDAGCPAGRGPSMVAYGSVPGGKNFCIDRTEVTLGQYTVFKDEAVAPSTQPAECAWNTRFAAGGGGSDAHPVVFVNWCDAKAFCRWAGKHLCGEIGGTPTAPGGSIVTASGQWAYACSNGGASKYPYGATYQADTCNIAHAGGAPIEAGALPGCGTSKGALDLIGNVWEWVDDRTPSDAGGSADLGYFLGGEFSSPDTYDCVTPGAYRIDFLDARVGFRCCAENGAP